MPFTLTRSILVIIIPGLVALSPWALWAVSMLGDFDRLYQTYTTLIHTALVGIAVIVGSLIEGGLSHLEVHWDRQREAEYAVRENWFAYLAQQCSAEPVGFRYISRMFTTLYFELAMMVAAPIALVGVAALAHTHLEHGRPVATGLPLVLALAVVAFLYREARGTHRVLCEARRELNRRLNHIH